MVGKRYFFLLFLQLWLIGSGMFTNKLKAQIVGREWIVDGQNYFKIPVAADGVYGISFAELSAAGVPASFLASPQNLQLFHRGIEQAIHLTSDSLIFYGQRNDGTLDSLLYKPYSNQPHKYYNLYSDTTAYFLTWAAGTTGKRMAVSAIAASQTADAYHMAENLQVYTDNYEQGYRHGGEIYMTYGDQGEGWFSIPIEETLSNTFTLDISNVFASGPQAELEIMFIGKNGTPSTPHVIEVVAGSPSAPSSTFTVPTFFYHDVQVLKVPIPLSNITGNSFEIKINNKDNLDNVPSMILIGYIRLKYPQTFQMGTAEKYFNTLESVGGSTVQISNPPSAAAVYDLSDKSNVGLINYSLAGGMLSANLSASASGHKLFITSPSSYLKASSIKEVEMTGFTNASSADYIIISHQKIMKGAREYAAYRASNAGGAYDTLLVDVNKLYNLYSYGERTPVAIRRFLIDLFNAGDPKYLFIIGKGLSLHYWDRGDYYRKNPGNLINYHDSEYRREDLVPCFGVPCSDLLFSMGLNGSLEHLPALATGRLAAKSTDEVKSYLNKVKENESTPNELWRKNLIHLSGGKDTEKTDFYNHMQTLKNIAEDTVYGGKVVRSFSKKGNGAVDNELASSVAEEVNKGVSFVTFLGHSAPGVTDLDIGYVSQPIYGYNNKGKYPMLMINGCSASMMFTRNSFSEDWTLTPNKGAILTLGHSDAGYASELKAYSSHFYKSAFQSRAMVGKPMGDVQLHAMKAFYNQYTFNGVFGIGETAEATLQQMILQGDPGVRIYRPNKTDYFTDDSQLSIKSIDNKGMVTAVSDSFAIAIVVSNLGVDFGDSLQISVKRTINDQVFNYGPISYGDVKYQDTLFFIIRTKDVATYGVNIFDITLDPDFLVDELNESNNTAQIRYFMPLSGVTPLFPKEYSIVNSSPVTFVAQSTNLLVSNTDYFIELDTSYLFNSSSLIRKSSVVNAGSLIKWENVALPLLRDSLVYYWRIRYNTISLGQDTLWGGSSFIYIDQSPEGWSQTTFPQFFKDEANKIVRDTLPEQWNYTSSRTIVSLKTVGNGVAPKPLFPLPFHNTTIRLNGFTYEFRGVCYNHSLFAITFDKTTAIPYSPYQKVDGGAVCGNYAENIVNYFTNLSDVTSPPNDPPIINNGTDNVPNNNHANFNEYLNSVPTGDYVVFGNSGNAYFDSWPVALKNRIKAEYGAKLLDSLHDGMTYILVAKKGEANPIFEDYGTLTEEIIHVDTLYGFNNKGYITSTLIGPASSWGTMYRKVKKTDPTDSYTMKIIGVDISGNHVDTLDIVQKDSLDLTAIPALNAYPYIKLLAELSDNVSLTPPQLTQWQVIYGGVPEGTMNPSLIGLNAYATVTKAEGDSISVCYAFENISPYDFPDTLQVKYTITNRTKGASSELVKLTKLKQDTLVRFCYTFSTKGLSGSNVLQAFVNPRLQKEEYYNNNIVEMSFNVEKDNIHPILDVVFDGVHIMDGDIVSPSPMITVTLNDENRYLIRNSTDDIELFIQRPTDATPQLVNLSNSDIVARQVGVNGKNVYQIDYNPKNLPDGVYTLVVRGKDLSENPSGAQDYKITFEVINESAITNFYPYPNPFSTNTRFVFTLTGNEVPQDMKIQIMTVTGKVVREITKAELGPLRIGNNKTEYAWDGTDEFGDKLANGVYLYRVVLKNSNDFKHRETAGDKAFHKGYGKLYILR